MQILSDDLCSKLPGRIINIHPSLLPKYKGVAAWKQALEAGEEEAGCTVHHVSAEVDAGVVLGVVVDFGSGTRNVWLQLGHLTRLPAALPGIRSFLPHQHFSVKF